MTKTFRREPDSRFPTDEAGKEDATGFTELIRTLNVLGRTLDNVPPGNRGLDDDRHRPHRQRGRLTPCCTPVESRQDDIGDAALVLLADGMGGYEAGEVAAALAIQMLRQVPDRSRSRSTRRRRASAFPTDPLALGNRPEGHAAPPTDVEAAKTAAQGGLQGGESGRCSRPRAPRAPSGAAWAARRRSSTSTAATSSSATSATAAPIT